MLETIREYGLEKLATSGEQANVEQSHAHYFLALVDAGEPALSDIAADGAWINRILAEQDNLRCGFDVEPNGAGARRNGLAFCGCNGLVFELARSAKLV